MNWDTTNEWLKSHAIGEGWSVRIEIKHPKSGLPIVILHNREAYYPWVAEYAGSGHYFKELWQAEAWVDERMGKP